MFNIDIDGIVIAKIMRQYNSRKISSELLFLLLVTIIVSSITLANSSASDMALEQGKHKIYSIRDSGPGSSDTGCPAGYTVSGVLEDECTGKGTVKKTCPNDYRFSSEEGGICFGPENVLCDTPPPKSYRDIQTFHSFTPHCVGPPIDGKAECPPGFRNISEDPRYCVGPRKF